VYVGVRRRESCNLMLQTIRVGGGVSVSGGGTKCVWGGGGELPEHADQPSGLRNC